MTTRAPEGKLTWKRRRLNVHVWRNDFGDQKRRHISCILTTSLWTVITGARKQSTLDEKQQYYSVLQFVRRVVQVLAGRT